MNRVIFSSLCALIDASQRELRHLQCVVSVCVCVHTTVCVCEPHLLQKYGCVGFEDGSSTGSSPAWCKMWWESKEKESNRYLPKIAMLFGVAPSAKNSDFTARLRHLPSLFNYFFCAIYFHNGVLYFGDMTHVSRLFTKVFRLFGIRMICTCFLDAHFVAILWLWV